MYVRAIFRYMEPVKRPAAGYEILVLLAEYRKGVLTEKFALKMKSVLRGILAFKFKVNVGIPPGAYLGRCGTLFFNGEF